MDNKLFGELLESVSEAGEIRRGEEGGGEVKKLWYEDKTFEQIEEFDSDKAIFNLHEDLLCFAEWHGDLERTVKFVNSQNTSLMKERDELAARVIELEEAIKYTMDPDNEPEYHDEGMGCGLEDRGITDRYEAMHHGWESAIGRIYSEVMPPDDLLDNTPAASLNLHDADVLMDLAESITDPALWLGDDMFNHILEKAGRLRQEAEK